MEIVFHLVFLSLSFLRLYLRTKCSNYNAVWSHSAETTIATFAFAAGSCSSSCTSFVSCSFVLSSFLVCVFLRFRYSFRLVHFGQVILFSQPKQFIFHGIRITLFDCNSCNVHSVTFQTDKALTYYPLLSPDFHLFTSLLWTNVHCFYFHCVSLFVRVDHRLVIHS